jgi:Peptidase family M49
MGDAMVQLLALFLICMVVTANSQTPASAGVPGLSELRAKIDRFAPVELKVDVSGLSAGDRQALAKLIEAARIFDPVFMRQLWDKNLPTWERVQRDRTALGQARRHYYWINKGPWSDLDDHASFIAGAPARKPLGANFYPEDMTNQEFEAWVSKLPTSQQDAARGFFTVIRRVYTGESSENRRGTINVTGKGMLMAIPYSDEYHDELQKAATLLREAANLTGNATLKRFLNSRADAFLSNDYYASDIAWMELDSPIEVTIGPYETYNDERFGYKAAFEAYIQLRDEAESNKLAAFAGVLQDVENHLPEDARYHNPNLGAAAPIRVVNEVFAAGDGNHGVQTAAYNLPNDERVIREKGAKRVMMRNVQEAKFHSVLLPIAQRTLSAESAKDVNFESFFTHILAHELMHGLGPHSTTVNGAPSTPRQDLKDLYSTIEEAKADATGLWALQYLMDNAERLKLNGVLPTGAAAERQLYTTFLASSFRTLRFGTTEAHGRGMALQFNYLLDKGAFIVQPDGTFAVDFDKVKSAVQDLTHDLLTLEATGDYDGAHAMLQKLAVIRPQTQRALDRLRSIPVDIEPKFVTAEEIAPVAREDGGERR